MGRNLEPIVELPGASLRAQLENGTSAVAPGAIPSLNPQVLLCSAGHRKPGKSVLSVSVIEKQLIVRMIKKTREFAIEEEKMKNLKIFSAVISLIGIIALVLVPMDTLAKKKKKETVRLNWLDFKKADLPAYIRELRSPTTGYSINLNGDGISYGNWVVSFHRKMEGFNEWEMPVALLESRKEFWQSGGTTQDFVIIIKISPLTCSNKVLGEMDCYLTTKFVGGNRGLGRGYHCYVNAGKVLGEEQSAIKVFDINCPEILLD